MKKIFFVLAVAASVSFSSAGYAASQCYTPREVEAEQGLRIQSELMVIALTCMKMPQSQDMYTKYQSFTRKNQTALTGYENELIGYFRNGGSKNAEQDFHTLRTGLANKISQSAIRMSTLSFCQNFGPRVDTALAMDPAKFQRWAQHPFADSPTSRPACTASR